MRTLKDSSSVIDEKVNVKDAFMPFVKDWRYCIWALQSVGLGGLCSAASRNGQRAHMWLDCSPSRRNWKLPSP